VRLFLHRGVDPVEADAERWATPLAWAEKKGIATWPSSCASTPDDDELPRLWRAVRRAVRFPIWGSRFRSPEINELELVTQTGIEPV
jgi:hypothetical protein